MGCLGKNFSALCLRRPRYPDRPHPPVKRKAVCCGLRKLPWSKPDFQFKAYVYVIPNPDKKNVVNWPVHPLCRAQTSPVCPHTFALPSVSGWTDLQIPDICRIIHPQHWKTTHMDSRIHTIPIDGHRQISPSTMQHIATGHDISKKEAGQLCPASSFLVDSYIGRLAVYHPKSNPFLILIKHICFIRIIIRRIRALSIVRRKLHQIFPDGHMDTAPQKRRQKKRFNTTEYKSSNSFSPPP